MKCTTALNTRNTHTGIHKLTITIFSDLYKYKYNLTLLVEVERNHKKDCCIPDSLGIPSQKYNGKGELIPLDYHSKITEIMKIPSQFHRMELIYIVRTLRLSNVICRNFTERTFYFTHNTKQRVRMNAKHNIAQYTRYKGMCLTVNTGRKVTQRFCV